MSIDSQYEREEQALYDEYERGDISSEEYRRELRDLQRAYRAAAHESAQDAYDREMERW